MKDGRIVRHGGCAKVLLLLLCWWFLRFGILFVRACTASQDTGSILYHPCILWRSFCILVLDDDFIEPCHFVGQDILNGLGEFRLDTSSRQMAFIIRIVVIWIFFLLNNHHFSSITDGNRLLRHERTACGMLKGESTRLDRGCRKGRPCRTQGEAFRNNIRHHGRISKGMNEPMNDGWME